MERAGVGSGGSPPRGFVADLASLAQVRRLAEEVAASSPSIDVLINNAGVFEQQLRKSEVRLGVCGGLWGLVGVVRGLVLWSWWVLADQAHGRMAAGSMAVQCRQWV